MAYFRTSKIGTKDIEAAGNLEMMERLQMEQINMDIKPVRKCTFYIIKIFLVLGAAWVEGKSDGGKPENVYKKIYWTFLDISHT